MSVNDFFNNSVTVERLTEDEEEDTEEYGEHITDLECLIYPLEENFGTDLEGSYGKDFIMISDIEDILEGDKIIDEDGFEYIVKGKRNFSFKTTDLMELRIRQMPESES